MFGGPDPISEEFPHVSSMNYAENSPVANIDLHGLQAQNVNALMRQGITTVNPNVSNAELNKVEQSFNSGFFSGSQSAATFTDANDIAVLGSAMAGYARNIDGSNASATDVAFATAGIFLAILSGSAIKRGIDKLFGSGNKGSDVLSANSLEDVSKNLLSNKSDNLGELAIEQDEEVFQIFGQFKEKEFGIQGNFELSDGVLTINRADFEGNIGVGNFRPLIQEFGKLAGVNRVIINPKARASGANPGKVQRSFDITIDN